MKFLEGLCEALTRALGLSAVSPWNHDTDSQQAIGPSQAQEPPHTVETLFPATPINEDDEGISLQYQKLPQGKAPTVQLPDGPVFAPPNGSPGFFCDYRAMKGWKHTASRDNRGAWLEKPIGDDDSTGGIYNIHTNYDQYAPIGTTRKYHLNVTDQNINTDGIDRPDGGKVFNGQYPGPWLEACWGDWVEITVENHLRYNGTTVHWHGVRMLNAFEHDGVNAITQCPIAPGDQTTYKFRVTQYGTSWYHSHYSLQYADGLAGPMTFHGPSSANYDVAVDPLLFGDWSHNSAFEDYAEELRHPPANMKTVILNGKGFYNCTNNPNPDCKHLKKDPPPIHEEIFERGRRYLLRLINTSTASTFVFSIDKHILQVVSMDFVAIEPYYADSILVGIGQRYHVIVEARPANDLIPTEDQNYWIRIIGARGCLDIEKGQENEKLGIVRYNAGSTKTPTTTKYRMDIECADEPYESLVPVVPIDVTAGAHPANDIDAHSGDNFEVGVEVPDENYTVPHGNFSRWDILDTPMWLNFSDPVIDHIGDYSWGTLEDALITENYGKEDWVYLIIAGQGTQKQIDEGKRVFVPVAHPMHLHGHDYVLLAQENRPFHPDDVKNGTFNYKNPPRRDVALMPRHGYVAVAFRTDNPGLWIMHCHIAWHASSGLALTVRENEHQIRLSRDVVREKDRVCKNWRTWFNDHSNWWDAHEFQEDSGI
jgi:FtsP/CotA-like multicopper oxidase with cupredoxin domain